MLEKALFSSIIQLKIVEQGRHLMGESKNSCFRVGFNPKLKIGFRGAQVTSDGGLAVIRELDEQLGLTRMAALPER